MSCMRRLLSVVYPALFVFVVVILKVVNGDQSCNNHPPSSCGNIHNISYPFRLKSDPQNCGNKNYELSCENNLPLLYLFSGKYNVLAINYNNYTIRLLDVGIHKGNFSSLPLYYLSYDDSFPYPESLSYSQSEFTTFALVVSVDCENPVSSPYYKDITSSSTHNSNSSLSPKRHSYLAFGINDVSDVADLCRLDKIYETGIQYPEANSINSFVDFHNLLAYGFEISWVYIICENCTSGCSWDENYTVNCYKQPSKQALNIREFLRDFISYYAPPMAILKITGWILLGRTSCGMLCLFAFLIYKFRRRHLSIYDSIEGFLQSQNNLMPIRYSYFQIKLMTKGFKDKLGEGGYGSVYKGKLRSGRVVAIKILGKPKANGQDFINEVATIGRIHHVNVVRLIGFCAQRSKRALVYDFMPNGSLEKYIFSQEGNVSLSCKQMFEISLGVARGIEYLHRGCDMQILHFDIKPHNILLDENFTAKVSDFGLAKLYPTDDSIVSLTAARGTMGYMAPELFYKNIGRVSYKADVYSFGMLLMEMAGRRRNLNVFADHASQIYFPSWVYDQFKEGRDVEMGATTDEEREMVRKMTITALWCIQLKPSERPAMNKVVEMLEGNINLLQMPPKPFLTPQDMPADDH